MNSKNYRGFTLVEILVVITIVGALSAVILNSVHQGRVKAQAVATIEQLAEIETALTSFILEEGATIEWPATSEDWTDSNYFMDYTLDNLLDTNDYGKASEFDGLNNYFPTDIKLLDEATYGYDFRYGDYRCTGPEASHTGVNIRMNHPDSDFLNELFTEMDKILDDSDGIDCGVVRMGGWTGSIYYRIAENATDF